MRFTKPKHVVGLDIGSHSVKAVQVSRSGRGLTVDEVGYAAVDRALMGNDPVLAQASAVADALREMSVQNSMVVGALPGQTVVIRYPRLRGVSQEKLERAIQREASQNIPYDLSEVLLDWTVLDTEGSGDDEQRKILLVAAKHEIIDGRVQIAQEANVQFSSLTVDSLALADAAESCDYLRTGETTALINIGAQSVSIHFTKDGVSNFIRDISWGAKEMIHAIAKSRRCEYGQAESLLADAENEDSDGAPTAAIAQPADGGGSPPPLPGGGNPLEPLEEELQGNDVPVLEASGGKHVASVNELVRPPIGRLITEIRRSFDYYEHQLYERPVDRVILSGGVAHLSMIHEALREDLGIDDITVAGFESGPIRFSRNCDLEEFQDHPAQFLVAVGLAARGAADL